MKRLRTDQVYALRPQWGRAVRGGAVIAATYLRSPKPSMTWLVDAGEAYIEEILAHEAVHVVLHERIGCDASRGWDYVDRALAARYDELRYRRKRKRP
jgi:predicted SprT family Zn-dependent metalloprotease